jgi:hypothetical protein
METHFVWRVKPSDWEKIYIFEELVSSDFEKGGAK